MRMTFGQGVPGVSVAPAGEPADLSQILAQMASQAAVIRQLIAKVATLEGVQAGLQANDKAIQDYVNQQSVVIAQLDARVSAAQQAAVAAVSSMGANGAINRPGRGVARVTGYDTPPVQTATALPMLPATTRGEAVGAGPLATTSAEDAVIDYDDDDDERDSDEDDD